MKKNIVMYKSVMQLILLLEQKVGVITLQSLQSSNSKGLITNFVYKH